MMTSAVRPLPSRIWRVQSEITQTGRERRDRPRQHCRCKRILVEDLCQTTRPSAEKYNQKFSLFVDIKSVENRILLVMLI